MILFLRNGIFLFIERACVKAFIYDEVLKGITKLTLNLEQYGTIFMAERKSGLQMFAFFWGLQKLQFVLSFFIYVR